MNYFEFYDLPISFTPDQQVVKQKFYALSKKYHPDFFIAQPQEKQEEALELSTLNNKAYQVLSNPEKLLPYILELQGVLKSGENYNLPQEFLMEMMDVNEAVMDLQFDPDEAKKQELTGQLENLKANLHAELNNQQILFNQGDESSLAVIKDLFYRNKYILRLQESLGKL